MMGRCITTQHWIIESAGDLSALWPAGCGGTGGYNGEIIAAVTRAIDSLDLDEAEFVRMYYLRGMSYPEIAVLVGCPPRRLVNRHRSAQKKLRVRLHRMLAGRYHIPARLRLDCPLCHHPRAAEIDEFIRTKAERDTWKTIIKILTLDFDLVNIKPQTLMTHRKYHML